MESIAVAIMIAMITTTTSISISVKPAPCRRGSLLPLFNIPVADVGVGPFAARLRIRTQGEEVILAAMRAGVDVLIVVTPWILACLLYVPPRPPVADGG